MTAKQLFAKTQYNGMILLSSYIYRLFVQQSVAIRLLDEKNETSLNRYKELLDDLLLIVSLFEQTKDLTNGQYNKIIRIYEETEKNFPQFFKLEPTTLSEKVAIVAASFYGERHLNEMIIRLRKLFDTTIASDYEKRIQFYNERIQLMDFVVHAFNQGDDLKPELERQIELWYAKITSIKEHVIDDLQKVPLLLSGN